MEGDYRGMNVVGAGVIVVSASIIELSFSIRVIFVDFAGEASGSGSA